MSTKWDETRNKAKNDILNAAALEFTEKGYSGATIRSIAVRAGVSTGLLGKYFESKDNILRILLRDVSIEEVLKDCPATDPYTVFCTYLNNVRGLQKEKPERFRFILFLMLDPYAPGFVEQRGREIFTGSLMEQAILEAQRDGNLISGEPYEIFRLFYLSVFTLLSRYETVGTEPPDNDAILNILGYNHRELVYQKQQTKLSNLETDLELLLKAVRRAYPLSICSNLTKNVYHMIDYDNYLTRKAMPSGSFDELIAVGVSTIPTETDRVKFRTLFNREALLAAFEKGETERTLVHQQTGDDGINRWILTRCLMSRNADGDVIVVSTGGTLDSTVKREVANIQGDERAALRKVLLDADAAAKTEFLFNMSHDIRTPMNAVIGFTEIAMKHVDDRAKVLDCLSKAQEASRLLLSLINSVLDMSNVESGHAETVETAGKITSGFDSIREILREEAEAKSIRLTFDFTNIQNDFVYWDYERFTRVFLNIVNNGIKYTPDGGFVAVNCMQLASGRPGWGLYRYTVEDNGIGMGEEFQKHVFDRFTREHTSTNSGVVGSGLGLAICKSYVELMGGTIECRSVKGKGTTFTVTLPFRLREDGQDENPAAPEKAGEPVADLSGKHILVVEDNELNREIARELLTEYGMTVEEAMDGIQAVRQLRDRGPQDFDCVLMDIQMPMMDGYEATRSIRAMYPDAKLPIIALSANAFAEDRAAALAAGMNDHIAKPIRPDELLRTMAKYIR